MENFKIKMLQFMKSILTFLTIISIIAFVLSSAMTIFYTEINGLFQTMGWSQERFAWMTVGVGSLGTVGMVTTRFAGTIKSGLLLSKSENERLVATNQKLNDSKFENQQRINEELREQMRLNNDANMREMIASREAIERQSEFNDIQAEKYINAPDTLVDPELKAKYTAYLNKKKSKG